MSNSKKIRNRIDNLFTDIKADGSIENFSVQSSENQGVESPAVLAHIRVPEPPTPSISLGNPQPALEVETITPDIKVGPSNPQFSENISFSNIPSLSQPGSSAPVITNYKIHSTLPEQQTAPTFNGKTIPPSKQFTISAPVSPSSVELPEKDAHPFDAKKGVNRPSVADLKSVNQPGVLQTAVQMGNELQLLQLESTQAEPWPEDDQLFVKQVTDQLELALQNAYLFEDTQKTAQLLASVAEITTAISSILDLQTLLETSANLTRQRFNLYHAHIFILENSEQKLLIRACGWQNPSIHRNDHETRVIDIHAPISIVARAAREKVPVVVNNVHEDTNWLPNPLLPEVQSELAIPIIAGSRVYGVLNTHSEKLNYFSSSDLSVMTTLAAHIGSAIQNAYLFEETQQRSRELATLNSVVRSVSGQVGLRKVLESAYNEIKGLVNIDAFFVALHDPQKGLVELPFVMDEGQFFNEAPRPLNPDTYTGRTILSGETIVDYLEASPESEPGKETYIGKSKTSGTLLFVPLKLGQNTLGCLSIQSYTKKTYSNQDISLIESIASQLSAIIQNARLFNQMQASEENFRSLVENAPEAIIVMNIGENNLIEPNENACKLLGLSAEELLRAGPMDLSPEFQPDHRASMQALQEYVQSALEGKVPVFEWLVKNAQGKLIPCEIHLSLLPGDKPLVRATMIDITDRKKAEEEALKFQMGIERSGDSILMTDPQGKIVYVNPAFNKIYGYASAEAVGQNLGLLQTKNQAQTNEVDLIWNLQLKNTISTEVVNRCKDGRLVNILAANSPIMDADGNVLGYMVVHHDITAAKAAEKILEENELKLRRQNEYLATAAEISRLVSSTLELDSLFSRAVDLIRSSFGYYFVSFFTLDEAGQNAVLRQGTGEVGDEMKSRQHSLPVGSRSVIGNVTSTGQTVVVNDVNTSSIHRPNPLLPQTQAEAGIPLKIGNRVIGALDIQSTEPNAFEPEDIGVLESLADQIAVALDNANSYDLAQKAITEMQELDRIKSQFLANMSHELRTPLNSIIGFSRVILKGIDGPISVQQQQDLTAIYNSGHHLLGLINDILDLSKIEAGKMELYLEELNLTDTINSVMSTAVGLLKDKPVKLVNQVPSDLPTVRGDPMRIRQVLLNLLSNAAKFTDEGSVTVKAEVQKASSGITDVLVSVIDTGPGIAKEDQEKLFQAFSQVDSSPTRKTGGTGLGLSICRHLIDLHGGSIGVHSEVGQGSNFFFTLPLFHQPQNEHKVGGKNIILCVDDDPKIATLYARYLQPEGYEVVSVIDPTQAIEAAIKFKPYAITLDIMMPGVDGWKVLQKLKSDPNTRNIPVIVCSILAEEEKGFELGVADYFIKPIIQDDLILSLNRLNGQVNIQRVLIVDDTEDDLRLMEKILRENSLFEPLLARSGSEAWEMITVQKPDAIILDLFMPEIDGFTILERLQEDSNLNQIPVVVISGADLDKEKRKKLEKFGKQLLLKGMQEEKDLFASIESSLRRLQRTKQEN